MNPWAGWKYEKPSYHERMVMKKTCKKCFLNKNKYPICTRGTCKLNKKGVYAAYIRARQYKNKSVARKAKKLLDMFIDFL
jgi:hypothetical protein